MYVIRYMNNIYTRSTTSIADVIQWSMVMWIVDMTYANFCILFLIFKNLDIRICRALNKFKCFYANGRSSKWIHILSNTLCNVTMKQYVRWNIHHFNVAGGIVYSLLHFMYLLRMPNVLRNVFFFYNCTVCRSSIEFHFPFRNANEKSIRISGIVLF